MDGDAGVPSFPHSMLFLAHASQRNKSASASPSSSAAMSEGGSQAHTPREHAHGGGRPPCSPFAPSARWSPRSDDGAGGAGTPGSALKRSRSDGAGAWKHFTGLLLWLLRQLTRCAAPADSFSDGCMAPPPRPLTNKRFLSEARSGELRVLQAFSHNDAMLTARAAAAARDR
jgi:hypothetical protein